MASSIKSLLFTIFMTISSCFAQESIISGAADLHLPCIQKLLPCQPILVSHSTKNPPPTCCIPLKQIVEDDPKCLCSVLNNPLVLKGFNITQDDALSLAKNCQANADISICKTLADPPSSSPAKPSPPATSTNSSTSTQKKSEAVAMFGKTAAISSSALILLISSVVGFI